MIEHSAQSVQSIGKTPLEGQPDTKEGVSSYERLKSRRQQEREGGQQGFTPSFQIKKDFTFESLELAGTFGKLHQALEVLEKIEFEDPAPKHEKHEAKKHNTEIDSQPRQLSFSFMNERSDAEQPSLELKSFDYEQKQLTQLDDKPDIRLGNHPTQFKIQNIITDEIIKAISNTNQNINIHAVDAPVAAKLANHVRELLRSQSHALTENHGVTSLKSFDRTA